MAKKATADWTIMVFLNAKNDLYYPTSKAAFNSDPDRGGYLPGNTLYPVEFVEREAWAKFLQAYLAAVPS